MNSSSASLLASESDLTLSDEQHALARAASAAAREVWDPQTLLHEGPPTVEQVREMWTSVSGLGVFGLATPSLGDGGTVADLAVVAEEWARLNFPGPLLSQAAIVVPVLAELAPASALAAELVRGVIDAEVVIAVADGAALRSERTAGRTTLSGTLGVVADGQLADHLLLHLPGRAQTEWALISLRDPAVNRRGLESLDLGRLPASVELTSAAVTVLGPAGPHPYPSTALACLAVELTATAEWALATAVDHVKQREQFGRPVGSFQGIKHRAAKVLVEVELARSMNRAALDWIARGADADQGRIFALEAAVRASEIAVGATWDLIGMLGGIGFTWEHPAHLAFRRARSSRMALGGCRSWQRELEAGV